MTVKVGERNEIIQKGKIRGGDILHEKGESMEPHPPFPEPGEVTGYFRSKGRNFAL